MIIYGSIILNIDVTNAIARRFKNEVKFVIKIITIIMLADGITTEYFSLHHCKYGEAEN